MAYNYWMHNLEVIQQLAEQKAVSYTMKDGKLETVESKSENLSPVKASSFGSVWYGYGARPVVDADSPLGRDGSGVASLEEA